MNDTLVINTSALKHCACCPAPCRSAIPAAVSPGNEAVIPSALAMVSLAVVGGALPPTPATRSLLENTAAASYCVAVCPYGHDIVGLVRQVIDRYFGVNG
ncbi:MAG: hypothetical protein FGM43_12650 [Sinobacteraceae bacterium]|nr:hypothetical protein [Nevskiaceae bacterium]